jgi:hypothetical protein
MIQRISLTLDRRLFSLLAEEIIGYLPQFEPYSSDYQMVLYACKDLKEWVKWKFALRSLREVDAAIQEHLESDHESFRCFLRCWTSLWVVKWRERVEVLTTMPKPPKEVLKQIKDTRTFLQKMKYRKELKQMLMRKLLVQGEICMVGFIAEQLMTEETARRNLGINPAHEFPQTFSLDILNAISYRISKISLEKGPLVYLNIKPNPM